MLGDCSVSSCHINHRCDVLVGSALELRLEDLLEIIGASSTRPYAPCANLSIVTHYHGKALVPQRQRSFYQLLDRAVDVRKLVRMQVVNTQVCGQLLIILGLVARWDVMTYVMFFINFSGSLRMKLPLPAHARIASSMPTHSSLNTRLRP
jgi:hypothetical protein